MPRDDASTIKISRKLGASSVRIVATNSRDCVARVIPGVELPGNAISRNIALLFDQAPHHEFQEAASWTDSQTRDASRKRIEAW